MATLGELAAVCGILGTVTATALPLVAGLDNARVAAAARYMASRLAQSRMEAIARGREVAIRFVPSGDSYSFTVYVDGNHNGVLSRDILRGIDTPIHPAERLSDNFRNVIFGVQPSLPPIDPGGAPPAGDPIRLGVGNSVSFSTLGTATSGTIYLTGPGGAQYAVRVVAGSAKIRVYRFVQGTGKWLPM